MVTVVWPPGFKVPQVIDDIVCVKPESLKMETPIVLIGVGVDVGGGVGVAVGAGVGVGTGVIEPVVDKVWLVVRRPAVSAVSSIPTMAIVIIAPDPSFFKRHFFHLD